MSLSRKTSLKIRGRGRNGDPSYALPIDRVDLQQLNIQPAETLYKIYTNDNKIIISKSKV